MYNPLAEHITTTHQLECSKCGEAGQVCTGRVAYERDETLNDVADTFVQIYGWHEGPDGPLCKECK